MYADIVRTPAAFARAEQISALQEEKEDIGTSLLGLDASTTEQESITSTELITEEKENVQQNAPEKNEEAGENSNGNEGRVNEEVGEEPRVSSPVSLSSTDQEQWIHKDRHIPYPEQ